MKGFFLSNCTNQGNERRWKMAGLYVRVPDIIYKQQGKEKQEYAMSGLMAQEIQACGWQTDQGWLEAAHVLAS